MWACPNCGIIININPGHKQVICSCQSYTNEGTKTKIKPKLPSVKPPVNRSPLPKDVKPIDNSKPNPIEICNKCPHYMGGHRCKLIDLGCRKTFNNHLRRLDCPIQKWQNIE